LLEFYSLNLEPLKKNVRAIVLLGLIAFILNAFPIPISENTLLFLGPALAIFASLKYGMLEGIAVSLLMAISTIFISEVPVNAFSFILEAAFIGYFRQRFLPVIADAIFWLFIGMPIALAAIKYGNVVDEAYLWILALKQPVNGFICTVTATLLFSIIRLRVSNTDSARPTLKSFVFNTLLALLSIPVLLIGLYTKQVNELRHREATQQSLQDNASLQASKLNYFLESHRKTLSSIAHVFSNTDLTNEEKKRLLVSTHREHLSFITMLLADQNGKIFATSPFSLGAESRLVDDRSYFIEARNTGLPYISDAFLGRGFGTDPIVAISAPFYKYQTQEFAGIVEGSLNLYKFTIFEPSQNSLPNIRTIIADNNSRVIFSSQDLNLNFLQKLSLDKSNQGNIELVNWAGSESKFLFSQQLTENGWTVYSLVSIESFLQTKLQFYVIAMLVILIGGFIVVWTSRQFTQALIRPVEELVRSFLNLNINDLNSGKSHQLATQFSEFETLSNQYSEAIAKFNEALDKEKELVRKNALIKQETQEKSLFLSHMSHELRTPLNAILGYIQLIDSARESDNFQEVLDEGIPPIKRASMHLLDLINDVLDFSKLEANKIQIHSSSFMLLPLVQECIELTQHLANENEVSVNVQGLPPHLALFGDLIRFKQVLLNLISNAIKYNNKGGTVSISCEIEQGKVRVVIADNGPGIPEPMQHKAFSSFNRLGNEYSNLEGTGLGLSIAKKLIEMMGGVIDFRSNSNGTTFWLILPKGQSGVPELETQARSNVKSILQDIPAFSLVIVEDNQVNSMILKRYFATKTNIELVVADTGKEGLALIESTNPKLAIVDINLPDINGLELVESLKSNPKIETQFIAFSANSDRASQLEAKNVGFSAYLTKPVDFTEMESTIEKLIKGKKTQST